MTPRSASAIEALVGLVFNRLHYAADMAVFSFGPLTHSTLQYGPRKGEAVLVGSHSPHVQCGWRLKRSTTPLVGSSDPPAPEAVAPAVGKSVATAVLQPTLGQLDIGLGDDFLLTVIAEETDQEQWRLLGDEGAKHLVWGGK